GRLARSVGPDKRHDLAAPDLEVDIAHQPATVAGDAHAGQGDQGVGRMAWGLDIHGSRSRPGWESRKARAGGSRCECNILTSFARPADADLDADLPPGARLQVL